ncbi:MAG: (d)CMP kinase [Candidatus Marinimicrobia bacterium]|nr:(d)CMP kinase [Candidatus Neomarinimicrobiota bacterium]
MIIAIDGLAATGKSTTAKAVADTLGFTYLDTGAMYRAVTLAVLEKDIPLADEETLRMFLTTLDLNILYIEKTLKIELEKVDVTERIRNPEVTAKVSEVSAVPIVRKTMVNLQRKLAFGKDCIVEGRDIGTVVFPNADVKFFMIADDRIRAERRRKDLLELGKTKEIGELETEIRDRDRKDSSRIHSPLKKAEDSIMIDTSHLNFQEQVNKIVEKIKTVQKGKYIK